MSFYVIFFSICVRMSLNRPLDLRVISFFFFPSFPFSATLVFAVKVLFVSVYIHAASKAMDDTIHWHLLCLQKQWIIQNIL